MPAVLTRLHELGIGAEVISPYELWLAIRLGVPGERIIYNGPAKSADVDPRRDPPRRRCSINANSVSEAALIARLAAEEQRVVNLGLRVALPGTWGGQFGLAGADAAAAVVRTALDDRWVALRGLHVHRGWTIRDAATMTSHVEGVLAHAAELRAAHRLGARRSSTSVAAWRARPSAAIPARQFRLNRALGTDLLPPDPADCLSIAAAAELAAGLVAHGRRGGGRRRRRAWCSNRDGR